MNPQNLSTDTEICSIITGQVHDFGKFYNEGEAKGRIQDYFDETGLDRDNPRLIFGQLLGLNSIKTLITRIDDYNNKQQPGSKIAGVRIYNAMSKREFLPSTDCDGLKLDIIIVPVLANGDDVFNEDKPSDGDLALGNAMPCPNQCGKRVI